MKRRNFLEKSGLLAGTSIVGFSNSKSFKKKRPETVFDSTPLETTFMLRDLDSPFSVMQISDSHISCDNEDDLPYREYSQRMGRAYQKVKHFREHIDTTPLDCFQEVLNDSVAAKVELLALTGDLINYPSATAVKTVLAMVEKTKIPHIYTAGNHDWHYEGMAGSLNELRDTWIQNRLMPLYGKDQHPLYSSTVIRNVNFVCIDNSTYQINAKQVSFFKEQQEKKLPIVLFVHIPLYMPMMKMCCGHPEWGASVDRNFELERRERWPESGNSQSTLDFLGEVYSSQKLLGVFTGHWHHTRTTSFRGIPQFFSGPNLNGHYRKINFIPED